MELTIRPATEDDAAAMVELLTPIVRAGAWTIMTDPPSLASQLDFIRGLPARSVLNVAETPDGRLVGLQDVQPCS
ncbi:MAG: GNAT family N-acetyltransferase, partial [Planctomycetota bacterium]